MIRAKVSTVVTARNLFEVPPPQELRREQRLSTSFRTGRLLLADGETICRVRNISRHGFMADICAAPEAGERVALELGDGRSREAKVAWSQAGRFGAEFLEPQSLSAMLSGDAFLPHWRHRSLRIAPRDGFATIMHRNGSAIASVVNISQTGVAVFAFHLGLSTEKVRDLRIEIGGLDPLAGTLRWAASGAAGIQFATPLSFEALSHWLWAAQHALGLLSGRRISSA